jgi:hypothetical protein
LAIAYLVHLKKHKLRTEEYSHGNFKVDMVRGLLEHAEKVREVCPGESNF